MSKHAHSFRSANQLRKVGICLRHRSSKLSESDFLLSLVVNNLGLCAGCKSCYRNCCKNIKLFHKIIIDK